MRYFTLESNLKVYANKIISLTGGVPYNFNIVSEQHGMYRIALPKDITGIEVTIMVPKDCVILLPEGLTESEAEAYLKMINN